MSPAAGDVSPLDLPGLSVSAGAATPCGPANVRAGTPGQAGEPLTCDVDERPAVARIRWTAYGGAPKYARVCEYHRSCTEGRRGVDVVDRYAGGAI